MYEIIYLVVNEEFELLLGILELQQAFKKHCDKRSGLLNEDANHYQWVLTLLFERKKQTFQEKGIITSIWYQRWLEKNTLIEKLK